MRLDLYHDPVGKLLVLVELQDALDGIIVMLLPDAFELQPIF